ncbi:inositol hexakisphosphate kinase 3-like [Bolinopsis microptera]|uniref:inositol hexakisphosphate kinase 3-like n=1 Tax=Bolinopsis microptera TaxID=2820187 RepID=UPI00307A47AD
MDNATLVETSAVQYSSQFRFEEHAVTNFSYQVGGRAEIVSLNLGEDKSIGKPLNKTEHHFYETAVKSLPCNLLDYIPCYRGVVEIKNGKPATLGDKLRLKRKGCYIVLEDVTSRFKKPSIMDLKMGTRQFSDTMSPEKIARKKNRSLATTSNELGVRVAGIRSFNSSESCGHHHMNKMEGRELTSDSILDAFRMFFFDGKEMHTAAIDRILHKLTNIIELIRLCDSVRLYCCSLLLVYESDKTGNLTNVKTDIRIIDFAEFQTRSGDGVKYDGPDDGFLRGLESLVRILANLMREQEEKIKETPLKIGFEEEEKEQSASEQPPALS